MEKEINSNTKSISKEKTNNKNNECKSKGKKQINSNDLFDDSMESLISTSYVNIGKDVSIYISYLSKSSILGILKNLKNWLIIGKFQN